MFKFAIAAAAAMTSMAAAQNEWYRVDAGQVSGAPFNYVVNTDVTDPATGLTIDVMFLDFNGDFRFDWAGALSSNVNLDGYHDTGDWEAYPYNFSNTAAIDAMHVAITEVPRAIDRAIDHRFGYGIWDPNNPGFFIWDSGIEVIIPKPDEVGDDLSTHPELSYPNLGVGNIRYYFEGGAEKWTQPVIDCPPVCPLGKCYKYTGENLSRATLSEAARIFKNRPLNEGMLLIVPRGTSVLSCVQEGPTIFDWDGECHLKWHLFSSQTETTVYTQDNEPGHSDGIQVGSEDDPIWYDFDSLAHYLGLTNPMYPNDGTHPFCDDYIAVVLPPLQGETTVKVELRFPCSEGVDKDGQLVCVDGNECAVNQTTSNSLIIDLTRGHNDDILVVPAVGRWFALDRWNTTPFINHDPIKDAYDCIWTPEEAELVCDGFGPQYIRCTDNCDYLQYLCNVGG